MTAMNARSNRSKAGVWLAAAALALAACATRPGLQKQYQAAIHDAAVRHADWNIPLWSFGEAPVVFVSTFTDDPALDTVSQVNWVAATAQVRAACAGKSNPVLFLEELLGLPPQAAAGAGKRWHVYTFEISQDAMFRPCPGGVDNSAPDHPRCIAGTSLDPELDAQTARFLLHQFWYSHRTPVFSGGAAEFGFPWTGMGWTYDWNPRSKDHIGVSEFVVRRDASPGRVRDESPAQFCRTGD